MGWYGGGGSAPEADPNIGKAALKSAEVGEEYLEFMKGQSAITNKWGAEDRARDMKVFRPMQDRYIKEANTWDSAGRRKSEWKRAVGDVRAQTAITEGMRRRQAMAMGVNPASGAFQAGGRQASIEAALGAAGAGNAARQQVRQEGEAKRAQAINMGSGLAVNPLSSLQTSNSAMSAGAQGAMGGYGQQGQLLNTQYQQQMQGYQARQEASGAMWSGIGSIAGMALMSSREAKENKKPLAKGAALKVVRGLPVDQWDYKPGMGDGGKGHIGTYAEDFQKATGQGDGKTIPVVSAIGINMGATKDLADKVEKLERAISRGLPERKAA